MQAFNNARHFHIENIHAVDNTQYQIYAPYSNIEWVVAALDRLGKAACLAAGHQSAERFDPPKCHPETRTAVINDIMSWVNADNPKERIMWLNGPAGAGKSSIAQTVAERCHIEHKLLSSFFFSRTATTSGRDDGDRLIPTIAYHLAVAIPEAKDLIVAEIGRNPAILSYSMEAQMNNLVMDTLEQAIVAHLIMTGISCTPQLVIIDGLDECNGPEVQSMILKVIGGILLQPSVHLRFLIASRPEWEIRKTFDLPIFNGIYNQLTLDDH